MPLKQENETTEPAAMTMALKLKRIGFGKCIVPLLHNHMTPFGGMTGMVKMAVQNCVNQPLVKVLLGIYEDTNVLRILKK